MSVFIHVCVQWDLVVCYMVLPLFYSGLYSGQVGDLDEPWMSTLKLRLYFTRHIHSHFGQTLTVLGHPKNKVTE